jgi:hypothetical protein
MAGKFDQVIWPDGIKTIDSAPKERSGREMLKQFGLSREMKK